MSTSDLSLLKSFILFIIMVAMGVVATIWYQGQTTTIAQASVESLPTPETSVHSSSADRQIILRATPKSDGTTDYSYSIADISGGNPRLLFTKTLPVGASMALPSNSWDPTDTYVFLEQRNSGSVDYFIFKSSGEPFADGQTYIDVGTVWTNKQMGYTIRTATGWASGTLLIIYTSKDDGSKGPAYWFEIPSTAILQLAG